MEAQNLKKMIVPMFLVGLLALSPLASKKKGLRFVAGFQGGTYYQIGSSLNHIKGMKFDVRTTRGSRQNIELIEARKADFGMAQLDILINMARNNPSVRQRVKVLLPIYAEEVHLIASTEVSSLAALKGRKVSIGPKDSGIQGTALILLDAARISDDDLSLEQLPTFIGLQQLMLKRSIDAMFVVAGAPVEMLTSIPANASNIIHAVPIQGGTVQNLLQQGLPYRKSVLRKKDYAWLKSDVPTVAVDSALIVRNDIKPKYVKKIIASIFANRASFVKIHQKWAEMTKGYVKGVAQKHGTYFDKTALRTIEGL